jgi:hypothetical protein
MSEITSVRAESLQCRCGCERSYPLFSGLLKYAEGSEVAFRVAHFQHDGSTSTKHLWLLLGSGPWFEDDPRGCWLVLDSFIDEENVIARVRDSSDSPFLTCDIYAERFLRRSEILNRNGALQWAIDRREDLVGLHKPTRQFLLGAADA